MPPNPSPEALAAAQSIRAAREEVYKVGGPALFEREVASIIDRHFSPRLAALEAEREGYRAALMELLSAYEAEVYSEFSTPDDKEPWLKRPAWHKANAALAPAGAEGGTE